MANPPDTTADYERPAALPLTQPPNGILDDALADWLAGSKAGAETLTWHYPDEQALDPGFAGEVRLRTLPLDGSPDSILLPRSIASRTHGATDTGGSLLDLDPGDWRAAMDGISYETLAKK